jgi:hypothetical protein
VPLQQAHIHPTRGYFRPFERIGPGEGDLNFRKLLVVPRPAAGAGLDSAWEYQRRVCPWASEIEHSAQVVDGCHWPEHKDYPALRQDSAVDGG